jgi:hypothetical protein
LLTLFDLDRTFYIPSTTQQMLVLAEFVLSGQISD